GYNNQGYNNQGYNNQGYNNQGYNEQDAGQGYGVAPPQMLPIPSVDINQIQFAGMNFPTFHNDAPVSHPQPYPSYEKPQIGNIPQYEGMSPTIYQEANSVQLSNCMGRKRALLIGINYFNSKYKLRGCINDVHRMIKFISEHFGFQEKDMVVLTDDQQNPSRIPTRDNILRAMKWLVSDAKPNDSFFFHYSGHGSRVEDEDGDELDGYDETICPVDFEKNGQIVDDVMNAVMVQPLPPGARLTAIFDCCHSGTALDLPFTYGANGNLKNHNALNIAAKTARDAGMAYLQGDVGGAVKGLMASVKIAVSGEEKLEESRKTKGSMGDVIMFSGCKDTQTSADAKEDLTFTGAMSYALTSSLYASPRQTYLQLLNDIRKRLAPKYTQVPQLSTGRLMDVNTVFIM
ncbi:Metacaspase-1, partial [Zancudomyces culisetae]